MPGQPRLSGTSQYPAGAVTCVDDGADPLFQMRTLSGINDRAEMSTL